MTFEDLKRIPLLQTRSIADAVEQEPETHAYIVQCLNRFYTGDYGEIGQEDTDANNQDLQDGDGHILARYKAAHALKYDIYIEAHFSERMQGIDWNNIMILYVNER